MMNSNRKSNTDIQYLTGFYLANTDEVNSNISNIENLYQKIVKTYDLVSCGIVGYNITANTYHMGLYVFNKDISIVRSIASKELSDYVISISNVRKSIPYSYVNNMLTPLTNNKCNYVVVNLSFRR